jgi:hypothetical protein
VPPCAISKLLTGATHLRLRVKWGKHCPRIARSLHRNGHDHEASLGTNNNEHAVGLPPTQNKVDAPVVVRVHRSPSPGYATNRGKSAHARVRSCCAAGVLRHWQSPASPLAGHHWDRQSLPISRQGLVPREEQIPRASAASDCPEQALAVPDFAGSHRGRRGDGPREFASLPMEELRLCEPFCLATTRSHLKARHTTLRPRSPDHDNPQISAPWSAIRSTCWPAITPPRTYIGQASGPRRMRL